MKVIIHAYTKQGHFHSVLVSYGDRSDILDFDAIYGWKNLLDFYNVPSVPRAELISKLATLNTHQTKVSPDPVRREQPLSLLDEADILYEDLDEDYYSYGQ